MLCIHEDSNANATLFRGTEPVFAVAEERLTRVRFAGGFPKMAVEACLNFAGITMSDVDVLLPANRTHFLPRISANILPDTEHDYFGGKHKAWLAFQHQLSRGGLTTWASEQLGKAALKGRFPQLASFVDHHTAHAYSAYMCSGYPDAVAITADNMGDGFSSKVFVCRDGRAEYLYGTSARHSPGQFYGEIAQLLGYHNLLAGKVTGLSAYGDPKPAYPVMEKLFALNDDGTGFRTPGLWKRSRRRGAYAELADHKPQDVAAACQKRLEDVMVAYVEHALAETGARDVVLAGGTFANVVLNQRILDLPQVDRIFVHPAMTDQGISMGAGFAWLAEQGNAINRPLSNIYLGPGPTESDIERALAEAGISDTPGPRGIVARRQTDIEAAVVDALVSDRIVARYSGRMEYGLRALGNRSILYGTQDPTANDWLNKRLGRSEFMPFAPVTMAEHATSCFERMDGGELAASYMTVTFDTTDTFRKQSPAVVHIDGTARPQVLREQDNPPYHRILALYREKTGLESLVNTSFNLHREPIVCTPEDAIRAFRASGIDVLALGSFLVEQERGEGVALGEEGPEMDTNNP